MDKELRSSMLPYRPPPYRAAFDGFNDSLTPASFGGDEELHNAIISARGAIELFRELIAHLDPEKPDWVTLENLRSSVVITRMQRALQVLGVAAHPENLWRRIP